MANGSKKEKESKRCNHHSIHLHRHHNHLHRHHNHLHRHHNLRLNLRLNLDVGGTEKEKKEIECNSSK